MNNTKRDAAREAAFEQALLIVSDGELPPDRAVALAIDLGFDAGYSARDEWVEIRSDADNPKLGGSYIVTLDWGDLGNDDPYAFVADFNIDVDNGWCFSGGQPFGIGVRVLAYLENFPPRYQQTEVLDEER